MGVKVKISIVFFLGFVLLFQIITFGNFAEAQETIENPVKVKLDQLRKELEREQQDLEKERDDLENERKELEESMEKLWNKIRDLMNKLKSLPSGSPEYDIVVQDLFDLRKNLTSLDYNLADLEEREFFFNVKWAKFEDRLRDFESQLREYLKPIFYRIKKIVDWWEKELITDQEFAFSIAFLIKENIIQVENVEFDSKGNIVIDENLIIPQWIKQNARWWADNQIDDVSFKNGIEYMIKEGIISFSGDKFTQSKVL